MSKTIQNRRVRIAVVGCGRIGKNHFGSIAAHSDHLELVAVCDNNPGVLKAHQERHQVPGYESLEDLLDNEQLDLVALCTPSGLHPEQAIAAARHGVHVMTEKPMATRWRDGLRMVRACNEAGVHLFVVKQNRRNTTLQLLKRSKKSASGRSTWFRSTSSGPVRRNTTTPPSGVVPGNSTAAPS